MAGERAGQDKVRAHAGRIFRMEDPRNINQIGLQPIWNGDRRYEFNKSGEYGRPARRQGCGGESDHAGRRDALQPIGQGLPRLGCQAHNR